MSEHRLTSAQRNTLEFLLEKTESGDFIVVPPGVTNDVRTLDALVSKGLIEGDWRPAALPPGSFHMVYRAVRPR